MYYGISPNDSFFGIATAFFIVYMFFLRPYFKAKKAEKIAKTRTDELENAINKHRNGEIVYSDELPSFSSEEIADLGFIKQKTLKDVVTAMDNGMVSVFIVLIIAYLIYISF